LEKIYESQYSLTEYYFGGSTFVDYAGISSYVADVLLPYTSQGAMFDFPGFLIRHENALDIKHDDIKSIFLVKLNSVADVGKEASLLRSSLGNESMTITRSEAIGILRTGYPRLGVGLDFTEINRILITAVSLGGVVAIAIVAASARRNILSLMRIRGGKRKDCVALFLPEIAVVLFLAGLVGTAIGLILGAGFLNSIADLIPRLFTGNSIQFVLAPTIGYFAVAVLTAFFIAQIVSIAASSTIDVEAV
jgi:predicted lysophospholipase L1 biosynthesis ABC-type transport system permease subunit